MSTLGLLALLIAAFAALAVVVYSSVLAVFWVIKGMNARTSQQLTEIGPYLEQALMESGFNMQTDSPGVITLQSNRLKLELIPAAGASIVAFSLRQGDAWVPLMRPTPIEAVAALNPSLMASFILLPWSNRIVGARFAFQGHDYPLRANTPQGYAIHGDAMRRPWQVVERQPTSATCRIDSRDFAGADENSFNFPFPLTAEIRYELSDAALDTTLTLVNAGQESMPAGFGFHPYFNRGFGAAETDEAQLQLRVTGVYPPLPGMLARPIATLRAEGKPAHPVPPDMDFSQLAPIGARDLDHCFAGWDGRASIAYPSAGAQLQFECDSVFGHVVVYTPPGRPFFAVEPVTHTNDGFNLFAEGQPGTGVRVLRPGEQLSGRFRIRVNRR